MTTEETEKRREYHRQYYQANKERIKANVKRYYREHRSDYLRYFERYNLCHGKANRERHKIEALRTVNPLATSTKAIENELPEELKRDLPLLRTEYRSIHITERPPYEVFIRGKIFEYKQSKQPRQ